jgi:hypothetical protein
MTKEKVVSRVTITQKTKAALKEYRLAKQKRFGVKVLQEEAINEFIQMAIPSAKLEVEIWEKELQRFSQVPEIK